ncbi:MAG: hypothetical protein HUK08_07115 [Bacteroidaceae bacterium]|nr:hypothetical protein [Bacteroidaceae bacterium]
MKKLKLIFTVLTLSFFSVSTYGQAVTDNPSSTLSPYSQLGLGLLTQPGASMTAGMDGLAIGVKSHNNPNPVNPASYSEVDSLAFIFDIGGSGSFTNFAQGGKKVNGITFELSYVVALFRILKNFGMSIGIQPMTHVGYDYTEAGYVSADKTVAYNTTYHARQGGLQRYYLGLGWKPIPYLSVGANIAYLHGRIYRNIAHSYSVTSIRSFTKNYESSVSSYYADFGLQAHIPVGKKSQITLGATYAMGHKVNSDYDITLTTQGNSTLTTASITAIDTLHASDVYSIPHTIGVGASFSMGTQLIVGADFSLQKWANLQYPILKEENGETALVMADNYYRDRQKYTIGAQYCRNEMGRDFIDRIRWRAGASYATPYYNIGNDKGPTELSISVGAGIPIINGYNNRSIVDVAFQYMRRNATGYITENAFCLKLGFTFNEKWFMKWKVK